MGCEVRGLKEVKEGIRMIETMEIQSGSEEKVGKKKYYPRAYKRLLIQERDLQIMDYCLDQKFLTVEQIARRFFRPQEGAKHPLHTAYRRMLTLQRFGMVKLVPYAPGGQKGVQTTELGEQELLNQGLAPLPVCGINYATAEHDRRVTDVRILFEDLGLLSSWTSDRYLKSERVRVRRVPDAIMRFKKDYQAALEVEIAWKGKERYQEIFSDYRQKKFGEVPFLFYVCNTLEQLKNLAKLTEHYKWVYYVLYEQLVQKGPETVFANKLDEFRLKELA